MLYRVNHCWTTDRCQDGILRVRRSSRLKRVSNLDCRGRCSHWRLPIGSPWLVTDGSRSDIKRTTVLGNNGEARRPSSDGIVKQVGVVNELLALPERQLVIAIQSEATRHTSRGRDFRQSKIKQNRAAW